MSEDPLVQICHDCAEKNGEEHRFYYQLVSTGECDMCGQEKPRITIERARLRVWDGSDDQGQTE